MTHTHTHTHTHTGQELEQERFSLQQRLECQRAALQAVQHDTDSARQELRQEYEMREEHLKQVYAVHNTTIFVCDKLVYRMYACSMFIMCVCVTQAHSRKLYETESLLTDLRGENERLEAQVSSGRERAAGLEERLREMMEQVETAKVSSNLQPEIRELERLCSQGLWG